MATCRLLDALVARNALERYEITVFGDEPFGAYNRILLGKILEGNDPDAIVTKPKEWYESNGVRLVSGAYVERLDPAARTVHVRGGACHHYDVAVLATGSQPIVPPLEGMSAPSTTRCAFATSRAPATTRSCSAAVCSASKPPRC
jgi:nitrite reductase (NADH) large subunit